MKTAEQILEYIKKQQADAREWLADYYTDPDVPDANKLQCYRDLDFYSLMREFIES